MRHEKSAPSRETSDCLPRRGVRISGILAPVPPEETKLTRSASSADADHPPEDPPSEARVVLVPRLTTGSSKSPFGTEATAVHVMRAAGRSVLSLVKVANDREKESHDPKATIPRLDGDVALPCQRVLLEPEFVFGSICSQYLLPARRVTVEDGVKVFTDAVAEIDGLVATTARIAPGVSAGLPFVAKEALFSRMEILRLTEPVFCERAIAMLSTVTSDPAGTMKATAARSPEADESEEENPKKDAPSEPVPKAWEPKESEVPRVSIGSTFAAMTVTRIVPANCSPNASRIV